MTGSRMLPSGSASAVRSPGRRPPPNHRPHPASCGALPDEGLRAEHDEQGEAFGVLGAGFGGIDRDVVAALGGEYVAVQRQGSHLLMVDGLALGGLVVPDSRRARARPSTTWPTGWRPGPVRGSLGA
jgi:hypothetical protein